MKLIRVREVWGDNRILIHAIPADNIAAVQATMEYGDDFIIRIHFKSATEPLRVYFGDEDGAKEARDSAFDEICRQLEDADSGGNTG